MQSKVLSWCRGQALFVPGARVVCAVSGGADSTAMLHCLCALQKELGITVSAAHYNHCLRGEESDRDEAFVRALCAKLGVPLTVSGGDVAARAAETGESIEEAARKMRYAFLESLDGVIATAHTADDNLETVLLNLTRGTSLRGLCGIPPRRGRIVRPVLCLTRAEIEAYLKDNALPHVEDSTNAAPDALRNRIRQEIVPLLRRENPSLAQTALRGSLLLRQDEEYLEQAAAALLREAETDGGWSCAALRAQPEALQSRAMRMLLRRISAPKLTSAHIGAVCALIASDDPSAHVSLPGGFTAERRYDCLRLSRAAEPEAWKAVRLPLNGSAELPELGLRIRCHVVERLEKNQENRNSPCTFACRCAMMDPMELTARPRAEGDAMRLSGGRRTLKRLMIDRKIPAVQRSRLPVIADSGGVLAVYGVGADVARAAHAGERAVIIEIEQTETN